MEGVRMANQPMNGKTVVANIIDGKLTDEMIEMANNGTPIIFINHFNFKRDGSHEITVHSCNSPKKSIIDYVTRLILEMGD